jgi:hypothetical protein
MRCQILWRNTQPVRFRNFHACFKHNLCPLSFIDVPKKAYVEGILGVYSQNRTELLRDLFVWG